MRIKSLDLSQTIVYILFKHSGNLFSLLEANGGQCELRSIKKIWEQKSEMKSTLY